MNSTFIGFVLALLMPWLTEASLEETFMNLTEVSVDLCLATFFHDPENREGYGIFQVYTDKPDQAIVASKNGYCFAAFRGTKFLSIADVLQVARLGTEQACVGDDCCEVRKGFYNGYVNSFRNDLEAELRSCAATCDDPAECVVLTGHSQGGSIAQVAALFLADLQPYVISFGNVPALSSDCPVAEEEKWFNFANSRSGGILQSRLYDRVFFQPVDRGMVRFGSTILLSEDTTGVANLGLNYDKKLRPRDFFSLFTFHKIQTNRETGYRDRIQALNSRGVFPVRSSGFADGTPCTVNEECDSRRCSKGGILLSSRKCAISA